MAPTITRTAQTDDDGTGTTGLIINQAWKTEFYDQIDAVIGAVRTVPDGGTGVATLTAHGVVIGEGASAVAVTAAGTAGQALTSGGAAADPTYQYQGTNAICDVRLTLTSATPVTTADVTAATNIFVTPYHGNRIALYDGAAAWTVLPFTEITQALGTVVNGQAYDVFAYNNAGAVATEILEWKNATVTVTIAVPGVVTWTAHGLTTGQTFIFTTSAAGLPTGVAANTVYFITVVDANSFKLSTTQANLAAGTFITTTGSQSGTHTGHMPYARQTALVLQDGVLVKSGATTRRYLGTFGTTATTTTEDSATKRHVWNYYNRVKRPLLRQESTATWTYTLAAWRQANGVSGAANQVSVVVGVAETTLDLWVYAAAGNPTVPTLVSVAIGEDSPTTPATGVAPGFAHCAVANSIVPLQAALAKQPALGLHQYLWLEISAAAGTTTWQGNNGFANAPFLSGLHGWIEG